MGVTDYIWMGILAVFQGPALFSIGDVGVPVTLWLAATHPERVVGANIFDGLGAGIGERFHHAGELVDRGEGDFQVCHRGVVDDKRVEFVEIVREKKDGLSVRSRAYTSPILSIRR